MLIQQDKTEPIGITVTANIPDHKPIKADYCRLIISRLRPIIAGYAQIDSKTPCDGMLLYISTQPAKRISAIAVESNSGNQHGKDRKMKRLQKAIYHPGSDNKPPRVEIYTTDGDIYNLVYCASYDADNADLEYRSPWQCDCPDGVWSRPCWHTAAVIRILYDPHLEVSEKAIYENGRWHSLKGEKTNGK